MNKKVNYKVNYAEGIVKCTLSSRSGLIFKGTAKKKEEDAWNVEIGKAAAFKKALIKKIKFDIKTNRALNKDFEEAIIIARRENNKRAIACDRMLSKIAELEQEIISL